MPISIALNLRHLDFRAAARHTVRPANLAFAGAGFLIRLGLQAFVIPSTLGTFGSLIVCGLAVGGTTALLYDTFRPDPVLGRKPVLRVFIGGALRGGLFGALGYGVAEGLVRGTEWLLSSTPSSLPATPQPDKHLPVPFPITPAEQPPTPAAPPPAPPESPPVITPPAEIPPPAPEPPAPAPAPQEIPTKARLIQQVPFTHAENAERVQRWVESGGPIRTAKGLDEAARVAFMKGDFNLGREIAHHAYAHMKEHNLHGLRAEKILTTYAYAHASEGDYQTAAKALHRALREAGPTPRRETLKLAQQLFGPKHG